MKILLILKFNIGNTKFSLILNKFNKLIKMWLLNYSIFIILVY